jgi:hypothetical protein
MIRIEIEQTPATLWIGKVINGQNVDHEVRGAEREDVLLKLLALVGVEVTYTGTHWMNCKQIPWKVVNKA